MSYIVLHILNETRPMWYYLLSAALFVLAQLAWFLLSRVICRVRVLLSPSLIRDPDALIVTVTQFL